MRYAGLYMNVIYTNYKEVKFAEFSPEDIVVFSERLNNESEALLATCFESCNLVTFRVARAEQGLYDPQSLAVKYADNEAFAVKGYVLKRVGYPEDKYGSCAGTEFVSRCLENGFTCRKEPRITVSASEPVSNSKKTVDSFILRLKARTFNQRKEGLVYLLKTLRHPSVYGCKIRKEIGYLLSKAGLIICTLFSKKRSLQIDFEGQNPFVRIGHFNGDSLEMDASGKVSLLLRTRNSPELCRRCLETLRNQTYGNIEIVVFEDGSHCCEEMIRTDFSDIDIIYDHSEDNIGRGAALNRAMSMASGEYMNIIDQDDYLMPEHIEIALSQLLHEKTKMVFCDSIAKHDDGKTEKISFPNINPYEMSRRCTAASCGVLFSSDLYKKYGGTNNEFLADEDWYLWLKYMKENCYSVSRYCSSIFTVPETNENALREQRYSQFDDVMISSADLVYYVCDDELKIWIANTQNGFDYLRSLGQLEGHLKSELSKIKNKEAAIKVYSKFRREKVEKMSAKELHLLYEGVVLKKAETLGLTY